MSHVLAIDQGTTSSRAIVFRSDISIAAQAQAEFPQHFPASGWVEHEPEDIWTSTVATCREALKKAAVGAKDIAAIGITNQRETTVVWDRVTGQAPHRRYLRQVKGRRPRARDLRQNRPDHRSLFLRNQSRMDSRFNPRRAGAC
jgi:glycerol kinase